MPNTIQVLINNTDRTDKISFNSVDKLDQRNQATDTLMFDIWQLPGGYAPSLGDDVKLYINSILEFGGTITSVNTSSDSETHNVLVYTAEDYVHELDRRNIVERFTNQTVNEIIDFLQQKYTQSFTTNNVDCNITVKTIAFDNKKFSDVLEQLSRLTNYSWYVDYEKDIHFFPVVGGASPTVVNSGSGQYLVGSLELESDITQLRNRVRVRGGDAEGNELTEPYKGSDGRTNDVGGKAFPLLHRFSKLPVVKVDGVEQSVGVEFLSDEDSYDCFWSFQEKYVRFKDTTIPPDNDDVTITAKPLYPIIVQVSDTTSINANGVWEFYKEDNEIKSREDAILRAQSEMESYGSTLHNGRFLTYDQGYRSGQRITINALGISDTFVVQSVQMKMQSNTVFVWTVTLASLHDLNIIRLLQHLLEKSGQKVATTSDDDILEFQEYKESFGLSETLDAPVLTAPPYKWEQSDPNNDSEANPIIWNAFVWS